MKESDQSCFKAVLVKLYRATVNGKVPKQVYITTILRNAGSPKVGNHYGDGAHNKRVLNSLQSRMNIRDQIQGGQSIQMGQSIHREVEQR